MRRTQFRIFGYHSNSEYCKVHNCRQLPPLSPSCSLELFNIVFFTILRSSPYCSNLLILGNFNVDLLSDTPSGSELGFRDEINTYLLISLVNIPTRVCPTSVTCIDHIYTNSFSPFVSGVLAEPLADHFPLFCAIPLVGKRESDKISIQFRDLSRNSIESLRDDLSLSLANFSAFDSFSVEDQFEIFRSILMKSYNSKCPIKHKNISVKRFK